jgi:hypothetical protein
MRIDGMTMTQVRDHDLTLAHNQCLDDAVPVAPVSVRRLLEHIQWLRDKLDEERHTPKITEPMVLDL